MRHILEIALGVALGNVLLDLSAKALLMLSEWLSGLVAKCYYCGKGGAEWEERNLLGGYDAVCDSCEAKRHSESKTEGRVLSGALRKRGDK